MLVGKKTTQFVVDSGAGVNIIDSHTFDEYCQNEDQTLRSTSMKLFTYGSDTPLQLRGRMKCQMSYKEESVPADIYVVSNKYSGCLLGKDTADELRNLKIDGGQRVSQKETMRQIDPISGLKRQLLRSIQT